MKFTIETAKKSESRARIALCGPPGSGKTFTALQLARGLADDPSRIILIDTENRSAAKYADGHWKQLSLPDYRLETYVAAIDFASRQADVLIVDSISHAWAGPGGALEMAEAAQAKMRNKMEAWRQVTPLHNRFVTAMVNCPSHIIVTMRTRTEWVFEEDNRGRTMPRKVGTRPIQREGVDYEFDIVCDLTWEHDLVVTKTRCSDIDGLVAHKPGVELGEKIAAWLSDVDEAPLPVPAPPLLVEPEPPERSGLTPSGELPVVNTVDDVRAAALRAAEDLVDEFPEVVHHLAHAKNAIQKMRKERFSGEPITVELVRRIATACRAKYEARTQLQLEAREACTREARILAEGRGIECEEAEKELWRRAKKIAGTEYPAPEHIDIALDAILDELADDRFGEEVAS